MQYNGLQVVVRGNGVSPEAVTLAELYRLLHGLEMAFAETSKAKDRSLHRDELNIRLIDIQPGSSQLAIVFAACLMPGVLQVTECLAQQETHRLPIAALAHLEDLRTQAQTKKWGVELAPGAIGFPQATITADTPIFEPPLITGNTTIYGICEAVGGGKDASATVRLHSGKTLTVGLPNREMARDLGHLLYAEVCVSGEAKWNLDMEIKHFVAHEFHAMEEASIGEVLQRLQEISPNAWDDVNPDEYVRDLRGDGHLC